MSAASVHPNRIIVAESDLLRVVLSDTGSSTIFVTFGNLKKQAEASSVWGGNFLLKQGMSVLGFMPKGPTWFPTDDTLRLIDKIRPILNRYKKIIGYGHSKGGYGALKYSSALESDITIATAPQASIVPEDVGSFDSRYIAHYKPALHRMMRVRSEDLNGRCIIAFDPLFKTDSCHVKLIEAEGSIDRLVLPFFAHDVLNGFIQGGSAGQIIDLLCQPEKNSHLRARQVLRSRRMSQPYYARRASYITNRRGMVDFAFRMAQRAVELEPDNGEYRLHLIGPLIRRGQKEDAFENLQIALGQQQNSVPYWKMVASAWKLFGRYAEAAEAVEVCIRLQPKNYTLYSLAADYYRAAGLNAQAADRAARAQPVRWR